MKSLVVIPTYNECENVRAICMAVLNAVPAVNILIVDDNSPDGTANIVNEMRDVDERVHLLSRPGKQGLGKAYLAAFEWGLARDFDIIVEMDADFSHRPVDLIELLAAVGSADFAIGSRYVSGGATRNWGVFRKFVSRGGSFYSRVILGYPIRDWTGGFNAWKRKVLEKIDLNQVRSEGYSFQIELKYRALSRNFKAIEVPILFEDRRAGQSKMSLRIVLEAFYRVWLIRFVASFLVVLIAGFQISFG